MNVNKVKAKKVKCENKDCSEKNVEVIIPEGFLYSDDEPVQCGSCATLLVTQDIT